MDPELKLWAIFRATTSARWHAASANAYKKLRAIFKATASACPWLRFWLLEVQVRLVIGMLGALGFVGHAVDGEQWPEIKRWGEYPISR